MLWSDRREPRERLPHELHLQFRDPLEQLLLPVLCSLLRHGQLVPQRLVFLGEGLVLRAELGLQGGLRGTQPLVLAVEVHQDASQGLDFVHELGVLLAVARAQGCFRLMELVK